MALVFHLKGCPRCHGAVVVDKGAHPADDGARCIACGWVPRPQPLPPCRDDALEVPSYENHIPDALLKAMARKRKMAAMQQAASLMWQAGLGLQYIAGELGVTERTVYRWRRASGHLDHQP